VSIVALIDLSSSHDEPEPEIGEHYEDWETYMNRMGDEEGYFDSDSEDEESLGIMSLFTMAMMAAF
jgi:hypothetical protein